MTLLLNRSASLLLWYPEYNKSVNCVVPTVEFEHLTIAIIMGIFVAEGCLHVGGIYVIALLLTK